MNSRGYSLILLLFSFLFSATVALSQSSKFNSANFFPAYNSFLDKKYLQNFRSLDIPILSGKNLLEWGSSFTTNQILTDFKENGYGFDFILDNCNLLSALTTYPSCPILTIYGTVEIYNKLHSVKLATIEVQDRGILIRKWSNFRLSVIQNGIPYFESDEVSYRVMENLFTNISNEECILLNGKKGQKAYRFNINIFEDFMWLSVGTIDLITQPTTQNQDHIYTSLGTNTNSITDPKENSMKHAILFFGADLLRFTKEAEKINTNSPGFYFSFNYFRSQFLPPYNTNNKAFPSNKTYLINKQSFLHILNTYFTPTDIPNTNDNIHYLPRNSNPTSVATLRSMVATDINLPSSGKALEEQSILFSSQNLFVSPNPTRTFFEVKFSDTLHVSGRLSFELYDFYGRLVYTKSVEAVGNKIQLKIFPPSTLSSGTYFLTVRSKTGLLLGTTKVQLIR